MIVAQRRHGKADMAEFIEESQGLESTTVNLWRNAKVVKGGRRFSLSALVVVGDRQGSVGLGYGKATGAPMAIEKATKAARKELTKFTLKDGTLPHVVTGKFCATKVRLIPAAPGTGVIAGATVRAVLEMAGVQDCLTKVYGSTNQKNLSKAVMNGLLTLRSRESVAELRGVEIESTVVEEKIAQGKRFMPKGDASGEKAKAPVNQVGQQRGGGGRGRNNRGRGRGRGPEEQQQTPATAAPATPAAPAAEATPPPAPVDNAGGDQKPQGNADAS